MEPTSDQHGVANPSNEEVDAILRTLGGDILARIDVPDGAAPSAGGMPTSSGKGGSFSSATPPASLSAPDQQLLQQQKQQQNVLRGLGVVGQPSSPHMQHQMPTSNSANYPPMHMGTSPQPMQGMMPGYTGSPMFATPAMYARMPMSSYSPYMNTLPQLGIRPQFYNPLATAAAQYAAVMGANTNAVSSSGAPNAPARPSSVGQQQASSPLANAATASGTPNSPYTGTGPSTSPAPRSRKPSLQQTSSNNLKKEPEAPAHSQSQSNTAPASQSEEGAKGQAAARSQAMQQSVDSGAGQANAVAKLGKMMSELSPPLREEIQMLWDQYRRGKEITASAFLERAKQLLGPEKFAILAALGQASPSSAGSSAKPPNKKRQEVRTPTSATQALPNKRPKVESPSFDMNLRSMTPTGGAQGTFAGFNSFAPAAPASSSWISAAYMPSYHRQASEPAGLMQGYGAQGINTAVPVSFSSSTPRQSPLMSTTNRIADARPGTNADDPGERKQGDDDMGDVIRMLGVNIQQEEELLRARGTYPGSVNSTGVRGHANTSGRGVPPENPFVNTVALRCRIAKIAGSHGLSQVTNSAVYYMALALQDRLRDVLLKSMRIVELRSQTSLGRDLADYGVSVPPTIELPTPLPSILRGPGEPSNADPEVPADYELQILSQPESALSLIQFRDIAAEVSAEEQAKQRQAATEGSSPTKTARPASIVPPQNPATVSAVSPSQASNPSAPVPPSAMAAATLDSAKKKRSQISVAEESQKRNASATAFFAAGGGAKSWMTIGTGSDGPGGGSAAPGATPMASSAMSASAIAKRQALLNRKRLQQGGRGVATNGQGQNGSNSGTLIPGAGISAQMKRLQTRDLLLALSDEIHTGAGKCNAKGVGKVAAKVWVKLREK